jgi:N utilization substance protein B
MFPMQQRRQAREIALQILYGLDLVKMDPEGAIEAVWDNFPAAAESRDFSRQIVLGTWNHLTEIDATIASCSENWSLYRMPKVDKSILRMAVYELCYCPDIPPKVAINEAIDLGKLYGSENSSSFINGILDAVYLRFRLDHANQDLDHAHR